MSSLPFAGNEIQGLIDKCIKVFNLKMTSYGLKFMNKKNCGYQGRQKHFESGKAKDREIFTLNYIHNYDVINLPLCTCA